jgi:subfamily B ATP-binding cassette protein MsbA
LLRIALKYLKKYASRMQNAMADYTTVLQETLSGIRAVKAYNAEKIVNKKFDDFTSNYVNASVKHQKIISIVPGVNEMFAIIAICVVLLIGGLQVFNGELKADDLMLFLFALFSVMSPISTIVNNLSNYQRGIIAAERVFSIIDEVPTVQTGDGVISDFNENITIKNVAFKYDKTIVLDNINFEIKKGKKIAFVGASGSGKSTMLDLIIRFYDPISGNILVDGVDISTLKLSHYRKLFGIVSQETILFNDTIANNIRYGVADITDDHILTACKIANAYGFISQLPEGLNTKIGDRGVLLSGGERQRVAIARAIVRDPKILVFDEATSALDAESEQIVQLAINDSLVNRTAIIVAHRLSTIKDCDEILIFDKGKIVERGNHQELFDLNGIYRKLYDIQFYSGDSQ